MVLELFNEMENFHIRGDPVFYNTLVSGLMFNQHLKEAVEISLKALEHNVRLNNEVYANMLKNLCRFFQKNFKNANLTVQGAELLLLRLCQEMKSHHI